MPRTNIPLHHLGDESGYGMSVHRVRSGDKVEALHLGAHRDDHGNFFYQEGGLSKMMLDFEEVTFEGRGVFCILPGQVHEPISITSSVGWFLGVEMALLDDHHRSVVEEFAQQATPVAISPEQGDMLSRSLEIMHIFHGSPDVYKQSLTQAMLKVCLGLFTSCFECDIRQKTNFSRPSAITTAFRKLLSQNFKTVKSPAAYAAMLNISPSYLNEVVKETSGKPVSLWIQDEVIMEAKRLLYYTDLNVKQISFGLGYDDHTYFSRLFRKTTGCSPGQFRSEYRK